MAMSCGENVTYVGGMLIPGHPTLQFPATAPVCQWQSATGKERCTSHDLISSGVPAAGSSVLTQSWKQMLGPMLS